MDNLENLAEMKRKILQDVENAEKSVKKRAIAFAVVEATLLITYLSLMDFHERLHWLILVAALLTYGTLTAGLVTLAGKINLSTQRVIKALRNIEEK